MWRRLVHEQGNLFTLKDAVNDRRCSYSERVGCLVVDLHVVHVPRKIEERRDEGREKKREGWGEELGGSVLNVL